MYRLFITISLMSLHLLAFSFNTTPQKISAYYIAPSQNLNLVKTKLKKNGFTILATTNILKRYNIITITNKALQNTNSYMATLQINVNANEIRVQNPSYLAAAYLGKRYSYGQFKNTVKALENALGKLRGGYQKADFKTLSEYRFMYGLPQKKDILPVKKDINIINKLADFAVNKYVAYTLTLPNGNMLVGHQLRGKTNRFLGIIHQERNAQLLLYESMINGQEASILNPKYYLALSIPMLSFHDFMQIASVPDRIYRNIKKDYH